jgi:ankyrin repeat protein
VVKILYEKCLPSTVNQITSGGFTALYWACCNNNMSIVNFLIKKCDLDCINSSDNKGRTPLYWACRNHNVVMAKLLIKHGAKKEMCDNKQKEKLNFWGL